MSPTLDPRRSALLLMDFQNDVVSRFAETNALVERVARVRAQCRAHGVRTAHIRVAFTDGDRQAVSDRNKAFATSGVVLSTVRDAADRDYRLVVVADCCADMDPTVHEVLTERVFPRQADVVTAADVAQLFAASDTG